jgi:hypothetical protein
VKYYSKLLLILLQGIIYSRHDDTRTLSLLMVQRMRACLRGQGWGRECLRGYRRYAAVWKGVCVALQWRNVVQMV